MTTLGKPSFLVRDSLLIKSAAIAFLHEDEFGSRSNLRSRKAMPAFLDCWRAQLAHPNRLQPDQHRRVARRISNVIRAYVGAGTENFRTNAKPLWAESRRAVWSFPTGRRWNQNVNQRGHRAGACRQDRPFSRSNRACR